MVAVADRHVVERAKWDAHATATARVNRRFPPGVAFAAYAASDPLLAPVARHVGDVAGKRVIEYGCGLGRLTILLARAGAQVTAFDLSERSVHAARAWVEEEGLADRVTFVVCAGEELPFDDVSFDVAIGKAVLHHLEPRPAARELARVLRPGGRAAFSEPLGTNPIVQAARDHVPYPHKHPRGADVPLRRSDVRTWLAPFSHGSIRGVQLLSMIERGFGFGRAFPALRRIDDRVLAQWPDLWPLCRYGVLTMVK